MNSTADRIRKAMELSNMRQSDLAEKTKISKGALSSYISGRYIPKQNNIYLIAKALNVNEAWLMGYDVPMERTSDTKHTDYVSVDTIVFEITGRSLQYSPQIYDAICRSLDSLLKNRNDKKYNSSYGRLNILNVLRESNISYDEKALALKSIIDMILFDTKKNEIRFFYKLDSNIRESQIDKLICITHKLNDTGLNKVVDYATDLSNMNSYTQNISYEKNSSLSAVSEAYLEPVAAHDRTDIPAEERTEELIRQEDDIMNDDNF